MIKLCSLRLKECLLDKFFVQTHQLEFNPTKVNSFPLCTIWEQSLTKEGV